MANVQLRGMTWNHSRGYLPVVATAQRFLERTGIEVIWEKRSLQDFADYPLQRLVDRYDLLIIDHPFVGYAASHPVLKPFDELLPADYLAEQAANSVGASHRSYHYDDHQWGLATDVATPVASYRADLFAKHGFELPRSWEELLELASSGMVIVPAIAIDSLMNFYYLCVGRGATLFDGAMLVDEEAGVWALEQLRALVQRCPPECLERNPIRTYDALCAGDDYLYCPFAYGYSNYGRAGYAEERLRFTDVVSVDGSTPGRTTLGGAGLAISAHCRHVDEAVAYASYLNDPLVQRTIYLENGGQPGHRGAWTDRHANELTNGFFEDTLATHDRAYLRPRYDGYLHFQDHGGAIVRDFVIAGGDPREPLAQLQRLYQESLRGSDTLEPSEPGRAP